MLGDLRDDVRRRSETVDAQALGITGSHERAIADHTGAEQRRGPGIGVRLWQSEAEALVCNGVLFVAPVDRVSGEASRLAQVFAFRQTVPTVAACGGKPRHPNSL